jgi:hypothetical protein
MQVSTTVPRSGIETTRCASSDEKVEQINATTQPSKSSIIFDFGGPGNINIDSFAGSNGQALLS